MKIRSVGHSLKLERPRLHFPDNLQFPIWVIIKNSPAAGLHVDGLMEASPCLLQRAKWFYGGTVCR